MIVWWASSKAYYIWLEVWSQTHQWQILCASRTVMAAGFSTRLSRASLSWFGLLESSATVNTSLIYSTQLPSTILREGSVIQIKFATRSKANCNSNVCKAFWNLNLSRRSKLLLHSLSLYFHKFQESVHYKARYRQKRWKTEAFERKGHFYEVCT